MPKYLLRLDDAAAHRNLGNWNRIEDLLDMYGLKPIVGIIPDNRDPDLLKYPGDGNFWNRAREWQKKGWCIALHGCEHLYCTQAGGIHPVNQRSEFASLSLSEQENKVEKGISILTKEGISANVFFAPAHSFDGNTLEALKKKSDIRIISDTVANDVYFYNDVYFIPQQAGKVRRLPFRLVTFCYHPNNMTNPDFSELESFILKHKHQFIGVSDVKLSTRNKTPYDYMLSFVYLKLRRLLP